MNYKSEQVSFRPAWHSAKQAIDSKLCNLYL